MCYKLFLCLRFIITLITLKQIRHHFSLQFFNVVNVEITAKTLYLSYQKENINIICYYLLICWIEQNNNLLKGLPRHKHKTQLHRRSLGQKRFTKFYLFIFIYTYQPYILQNHSYQ